MTENELGNQVWIVTIDPNVDYFTGVEKRFLTENYAITNRLEQAFQTSDRGKIEHFLDVANAHRTQHQIYHTMGIEPIPGIDSQTPTTAVQGKDGFVRTALVIGPDNDRKGGSVEILTPDGKRLCLLNLYNLGGGAAVVDVIVDEQQQITAFSLYQGATALRERLPGTLLAAIINARQPEAQLQD